MTNITPFFSHFMAFTLGGVAMAQLLNRRPHPPRRPLNGEDSTSIYCLRKALLHVMEARGWVSCVPPRVEDHLPTFVASLEQMLQRRIDAYQRNLPHHITPNKHHGQN